MYKLPPLPYDFNALEPVISAEIMTLHYTKHHQGYVTNLNAALEKYEEATIKQDIASMIALHKAIQFNGGGHINHTLFWTVLAPLKSGGGEVIEGELYKMIVRDFGSFEGFIDKMSALAIGIQGSGWAFLGYNQGMKRLELASCANQDPLSIFGLIPLLGIDVWEHAYYLQYKNIRGEYVKNFWKIVNWRNVQERFIQASI